MGLFDGKSFLDLGILKSTGEEDEKGYIVEVEASNEGLDQQEQVVLQRALLDSQDYFLRNGVLSWDHLHVKTNDPAYIIGEPISVIPRGAKTFVRARLYKGNKFAEDIVSKLKSGARVIRASVGGLRPVIKKEYDAKLKKAVEKVVSVMWNDLAITHKPVLDNLSPVVLVKSLMAGYSTDSATATGGAALIPQDLEGARKSAINAVVTAIAVGDVRTPEAGVALLADHGIESKEASDILTEVVNRRKRITEVFSMDGTLSKSFEEAIADLEKAMKPGAVPPATPPAPAPAPAPAPHAEPDGDEEEEDEDDEEGMAPPAPAPAPAPMKKSADDEDVEFLDVSPILSSISKSLKSVVAEVKAVRAENAELRKSLEAQDALIKSMGGAQLATAQLLKGIADQPTMRKSVLSRQDRFTAPGADGKPVEMSAAEILAKSTRALEANKISFREATIIEDRVNKGLELPAETVALLKSL